MIYEYNCSNCSKEFEVEQKITEEAIKDCPHCNTENTVKRLISRTSFVLQGSSWAKDGYSGKGY